MNGSLKNWFELMRISNLPTVLSSALVGVFMLTPLLPDPTATATCPQRDQASLGNKPTYKWQTHA